MDMLEHPDAQALLADAELSAAAVRSCAPHLEAFVARCLPLFPRPEQRDHARTVLAGKLTGLQRKTTEPIVTQAGQKRRPLQLFVGADGWKDDTVLAELRRHVAEELAEDDGIWILDGSGFPKRPDEAMSHLETYHPRAASGWACSACSLRSLRLCVKPRIK
jgi:hypothetical protein